MTLDFTKIIEKLQIIEMKFNESQDPTERLALLSAINYIAKHELSFDENDWVYKGYQEAMLRKHGADI